MPGEYIFTSERNALGKMAQTLEMRTLSFHQIKHIIGLEANEKKIIPRLDSFDVLLRDQKQFELTFEK